MIRSNTVLSSGCIVGNGCDIGNGVTIGASATVNNGLQIYHGATIASSSTQSESRLLAVGADGTCYFFNSPSGLSGLVASCAIYSLTIMPASDAADTVEGGPVIKQGDRPDTGNPTSDERYWDLGTSIGSDIARGVGCTGHEYDESTYNCNSYARDLDDKLDLIGFWTTFTVVEKRDPDNDWSCNPTVPTWLWCHSLVDVHWDDGKITWIEPMRPDWSGVDPILVGDGQTLLDNDEDGFVEYVEGVHTDELTDGDLKIEVFGSRAEAEAAWGHPFKG
jgi:hypothetical protein